MEEQSGVQSVVRAFRLLEMLAESQAGLSLNELSAGVGLPVATSHRLLKTMATLGYVRHLPSRRYGLGLRMMRLGQDADLQLGPIARPHLQKIVEAVGETANLAMLDGDRIVYVAQVPSPHAMRMFTEVGHRTYTHSTGVGKAILSTLDEASVRRIVVRAGMPRDTATTIGDLDELEHDLEVTRDRGYALDDGEHELGVRCYAVPLRGLPVPTAVSVSGPSVRLTEALGEAAVPLLQRTAAALAADLTGEGAA
ncbi:IclR family transcriptional regulator [Gryllotalpicola reticulitermitis]|uniref:IclR family transcriptional regulator n=1 Tax=Gryllotalpicola reticulitermitis TaxID=1184153 RepID=A0ABV8Q6V7_9MICO